MTYYQINDLLNYRQQMALKACGIFDEEEVNRIEPISYIDYSNGNTFVTVWMFGNKKIYSAVIELHPGELDDPVDGTNRTFFDVYRFKNIDDIRVDDYGCVITLKTGKKLELKSSCIEGADSFKFSAHGLVSLWDEYDD